MAKRIENNELRRLLDAGAQLVEVLPADEYEEEHLPGAISIPAKELDADSTAVLTCRTRSISRSSSSTETAPPRWIGAGRSSSTATTISEI
jgi:hypothetical protein